jgi:hypothetical protein
MTEPSLAQGFNSILGPAVIEIDQAIFSVQKSQDDLGKEIERLVAGKRKKPAYICPAFLLTQTLHRAGIIHRYSRATNPFTMLGKTSGREKTISYHKQIDGKNKRTSRKNSKRNFRNKKRLKEIYNSLILFF